MKSILPLNEDNVSQVTKNMNIENMNFFLCALSARSCIIEKRFNEINTVLSDPHFITSPPTQSEETLHHCVGYSQQLGDLVHIEVHRNLLQFRLLNKQTVVSNGSPLVHSFTLFSEELVDVKRKSVDKVQFKLKQGVSYLLSSSVQPHLIEQETGFGSKMAISFLSPETLTKLLNQLEMSGFAQTGYGFLWLRSKWVPSS